MNKLLITLPKFNMKNKKNAFVVLAVPTVFAYLIMAANPVKQESKTTLPPEFNSIVKLVSELGETRENGIQAALTGVINFLDEECTRLSSLELLATQELKLDLEEYPYTNEFHSGVDDFNHITGKEFVLFCKDFKYYSQAISFNDLLLSTNE